MSDQDECGHELPGDVEAEFGKLRELEDRLDLLHRLGEKVVPQVHHVHDEENVSGGDA